MEIAFANAGLTPKVLDQVLIVSFTLFESLIDLVPGEA
jgi:hypothetical protein